MAAPLQHITGVLNAMTIPLLVGACAVLADHWDADQAVVEMTRHRVTYSAGATVFLQELTEAARDARVRLPLRMFACGGASVPRAVMERSEEQGIPAARVYGMTELPTVTVMNRAFPFDLRAETDGAVAPGVEVRVVEDESRSLPTGLEGELLVRGPERMLGYLDPEDNRAALDDGRMVSHRRRRRPRRRGLRHHHRAAEGRHQPRRREVLRPRHRRPTRRRIPRCGRPPLSRGPMRASARSRSHSSCSTATPIPRPANWPHICTPPAWPAKRPRPHGISWMGCQ